MNNIIQPIVTPICGPVVGAITERVAGAFNVLSLFSAAQDGAWYKPSDASTLFQDAAGVTPVTTAGQPVGLMKDKSPNGNNASQATTASIPVLDAVNGGSPAVSFDGTDDYLSADAMAPMFNGVAQPFTIHFAWSQSAVGGTTLFSAGNSANANQWLWMKAIVGADLRSSFITRSAAQITTPITTSSEAVSVYTIQCLGSTFNVWVNGTKLVTGASSPSSMTSDRFALGALSRATVSGYGKVKIAEFIATNDAQSDATVASVQRYLMQEHVPAVIAGGVVDVLIVTGQSNAQGRGTGGPAVTSGYGLFGQGPTLTPLADPVDGAIGGSAWPAFANQYFVSTGRTICIIGMASGGSALIAAASANNWSPTGTLRTLAANCASDAIRCISSLAGVVMGETYLYWQQGEQDASAYNGTTVTDALYQSAQNDLFAYFFANIPTLSKIFVSELGAHVPTDTNYDLIRAAQDASVAETSNVYLAYAGAKDYPANGEMNADGVHYNQTGLNALGTAVATFMAANP